MPHPEKLDAVRSKALFRTARSRCTVCSVTANRSFPAIYPLKAVVIFHPEEVEEAESVFLCQACGATFSVDGYQFLELAVFAISLGSC